MDYVVITTPSGSRAYVDQCGKIFFEADDSTLLSAAFDGVEVRCIVGVYAVPFEWAAKVFDCPRYVRDHNRAYAIAAARAEFGDEWFGPNVEMS